MNNPKLTIITINLNNATGLRKTIESVVSQTYSDFEYIIIDGCSTDGSVEVVKEYQEKITYWVSEPDKGIYNAMNKGILKATGEYCLFLNSGDWLVNHNVLEGIIPTAFKEDIIHGNIVLEYGDKQIQAKGTSKDSLTLVDFLIAPTIRHQAAFIKRELFRKNGLYDESFTINGDWFFFMKNIIFNKATIKYTNINICFFDPNGIGSISTEFPSYEEEIGLNKLLPTEIVKDYIDFIKLKNDFNELENELNRYKHKYRHLESLHSWIKMHRH